MTEQQVDALRSTLEAAKRYCNYVSDKRGEGLVPYPEYIRIVEEMLEEME